MKKSVYTISSLPNEIALKIASSLEVPDLSSLGCCSRVWRELCGSDCLWESLFKERWPPLYEDVLKDPDLKGWRGFYIKQQEEMRSLAACVVQFGEQCSLSESLEVYDYRKAIKFLKAMEFGFKDVQMFLFQPKLNVLLNLVGLHYCLKCLQVPASLVIEALQSSKISDRQVCVKWWNFGRYSYGFRTDGKSHSRCVSLEDLATAKEDEVLEVLDRGLTLDFLQVQISFTSSRSNQV
ncbi:hypothetical protein CRYUN_Cryun10bG0020700 [Craigia yunnanensis]